ncbi:MAG: triose-phosphate isomerase [Gammaproteobacteria bacterium 39-13]|nr:triose-phosphate isomerase [Gammaproteobacteria bacterium]OJV91413.1 MAG: triose-phosphate isomerase [Gammaproteobacteria bacterium 39-13]
MNRKITVVGNWKMHGSKSHVSEFFAALGAHHFKESASIQMESVVCPPFIYLDHAAKLLEQNPKCELGAQDVSAHQAGAFTGQVAATMLAEVGCKYVIVGHSERRQFCQETDDIIAEKFLAAKSAGLTPILCVGETQAQREADLTASVVVGQLQALLAKAGAAAFAQAMIAYEPIWAIGTGLTATPEQAQQVHGLLRLTIAEYDATVAASLPILYGGSVKPNNARTLFSMPDINGALVGGASLNAQDFLAICDAAL